MGQRILGLGYLVRAVVSHLRPFSLEALKSPLTVWQQLDGEFPFQSFLTKKGFLFVTTGYLMVTTSPVILPHVFTCHA